MLRALEYVVAVVVLLLPVSAAHARTLRVVANGADSATCGPLLPCRSIGQALANAVAHDTIIVGPGKYRENAGTPACDCMVWVNKPVVLISSDGAAATVIDARSLDVGRNVVITAGGEFGRTGKGFTVTETRRADNFGILIDADDLDVRGNQVVSTSGLVNRFTGILAQGTGSVLIEGNQAMGWGGSGIAVTGSGKIVRRNQVSLNADGIIGDGVNAITTNIATGNSIGVRLYGAPTVTRNAASGNGAGFLVNRGFTGTLEENNILGNESCGLSNFIAFNAPAVLRAPHNYWGAATGPGGDPADAVCDSTDSTTLFAPVATRPFPVKAPINP
jgi:parallel beta-helix repeat protein